MRTERRKSNCATVIPYREPSAKKEGENDIASTMATTLPMVAVSETLSQRQCASLDCSVTEKSTDVHAESVGNGGLSDRGGETC